MIQIQIDKKIKYTLIMLTLLIAMSSIVISINNYHPLTQIAISEDNKASLDNNRNNILDKANNADAINKEYVTNYPTPCPSNLLPKGINKDGNMNCTQVKVVCDNNAGSNTYGQQQKCWYEG